MEAPSEEERERIEEEVVGRDCGEKVALLRSAIESGMVGSTGRSWASAALRLGGSDEDRREIESGLGE